MRPSASRNQRNKGFRVKHALQLFLLAAICVWLLYQLKHSYEKKRLIEETTAMTGDREADTEFGLLKLGRKDLPHVEDMGFAKTGDKEDENEEAEDKDARDSKQEVNEQVRGTREDETDEIDEQDQEEKVDEDGENGEGFDDEWGKDAHGEDTDLLDEEEHDEGSQEAREEHYKRDDASSAVRHHIQSAESEFGDRDTRNQNDEEVDDMAKKGAEGENSDSKEREDLERMSGAHETVNASMGNSDSSSEIVNGSDVATLSIVQRENETLANSNLSMNETSSVKKEMEVGLSKSDMESISNSTPLVQGIQNEVQTNSASLQSNNQTEFLANLMTPPSTKEIEAQNKSRQLGGMTNVVPLKNETVSMISFDERNATVDIETPREVKPNLVDGGLQQIDKSDASENGNGAQTESYTARENGDAAQSELDAKRGENGDALQGEFDNSSLNRAEKEADADVSILRDIQNGANSDEDEAAQ